MAGHGFVTLPSVTLLRCPSCGRAWDGASCFACGLEAARPPPAEPVARPAPAPLAPAPVRAAWHEELDDNTVEVERARPPPWQRPLLRFYRSPLVFVAAFAVGLAVTFGAGAQVFLVEEPIKDIYAADRFDDVIARLQAREAASQMEPADWLLFGHALYRKHGPLQRDAMLEKYARALQQQHVDRASLEHTILALASDKSRARAMALLIAWPATTVAALDATQELAANLQVDNFALRHAALATLQQRQSSAQLMLTATAAVALQDVTSMSCENDAARLGLQTMKTIADGDRADARIAFAGANPTELLLEMDAAKRASLPCVDERLMQATQAAVATVLQP